MNGTKGGLCSREKNKKKKERVGQPKERGKNEKELSSPDSGERERGGECA